MRFPAASFGILSLLLATCARSTPAPAPAPNATVAKGKALYARYCATCHGPDGNGYIADNAPSLRSPTFLETASDAFLQAAIERGRPGTAMGAYARAVAGPLDAGDVRALIAFLRDGGPPRVVLSDATPPGDAGRGKAIYESMCQRCHGTAAQRVSAVHLANPVLLETATFHFLRWAVVNGRPPTSMIAWQGALQAQQIDDVVTYIRTLARPSPIGAVPSGAGGADAVTKPSAPLAPAHQGPVVINPKGRAPDFTPRENRFISIDDVKKALDQKRRLIIADARPPADWANLHVTGSISVPYYDTKAVERLPNDGTWIIAYCGCPHHLSGELVDHLRKLGYQHTGILDEGVFAWQQKGYPVVLAPGAKLPPAPPPVPVPAHHPPPLATPPAPVAPSRP